MQDSIGSVSFRFGPRAASILSMWLCGSGLYRAMRRLGRGRCFGPDNISIWARHMAKADLLQIFIRDISDAPVRSGRPAPKLPIRRYARFTRCKPAFQKRADFGPAGGRRDGCHRPGNQSSFSCGAGSFSTAATTRLLPGLLVLPPGLPGSPRPPITVSSASRKPRSGRAGHRSARVASCAPFSGMAGTRRCYGRTIGSRDPRLQVAADRCGLLIVSPCDSIARSYELRLEM